jgi:hypothetical protein
LDGEAACVTELLTGKKLAGVARHRSWKVVIFFEDGTHFYVDSVGREDLELSVGSLDRTRNPSRYVRIT